MVFQALIVLVIVIVPEALFACTKHAIPFGGLGFKASGDVLVKMVMLAGISVPIGLLAGRIRRLSAVKKALLIVLAAASLIATAGYRAWACPGAEAVRPILKNIHAAQLDYHRAHGTYASSFDDLGFAPPQDQHSYFLPLQALPAKNALPRDGVDLRRLPQGISPAASADRFTAVATAFAEPDRIDVWTMDESKKFRGWSVAAFPKTTPKADVNNPTRWQEALSRFLNDFEGHLLLFSFLLGLSLGFAHSQRATPGMMPARS